MSLFVLITNFDIFMKNRGLEFTEWLQSKGRQTFTLEEAIDQLKVSRKTMLEILSRLGRSGRILTITRGLYALIHPSERVHGIRPLHIINAFMRYTQLPYYVGLLSAADFWGAAHHKPQVLQVIVAEQRLLRRLGNLRIELHTQKDFPKKGIVEKTIESGYFSISSIELTALDLLTYQSACGGIDNVCLIINDLKSELDVKKIMVLGKEYDVFSSIQRLGFLLESFSEKLEFLEELKEWVIKRKPSPILLVPTTPRSGKLHPDWKVVGNVKVELEP